MKLETLQINYYRSIRKLDLKFTEDVNVLVGPNGSGKTNILDAIDDCFRALLLTEFRLTMEDYWYHDKENILTINGKFNHNDEEYTFELKLKPDGTPHFNIGNYSKAIGYYRYIPSDRFFWQSGFSYSDTRGDLRNRFKKDRFDQNDIYPLFFNMSVNNPEELKEFSKVVSKIYPPLDELYLSYENQSKTATMQAVIDGHAFPFHVLASGVQQYISTIACIYSSRNSLIQIDEPELHMNPEMIINLISLLKKSAEEKGNQFILSTYSPSVISTPGINIIPLEYIKLDEGRFSTSVAETVPKEFVKKEKFLKGE